jgi:7,8-dihydroneopterin aldolase/epimerase/oxygenase
MAFAHPEDRAIALAGAHPFDRISLRDHVVEADIGAFQQERGHKQRVRFDVVVEVAPSGPVHDDVDRILSYDRITEAIAAELAAERLNLLETLAERIAARVLAEPQAMRIFLRIEKLDVGPYALGVEIVRSVGDVAQVAGAAVHPLVVHLDSAAIDDTGLSRYLNALQDKAEPVILTVGLPDGPRLTTGHKPTERRIDLLAIEQNAWRLAARDPRCVVVDTAGAPPGADPLILTLWLAETLQAVAVAVHGDIAIPAETRVPVRRMGLV